MLFGGKYWIESFWYVVLIFFNSCSKHWYRNTAGSFSLEFGFSSCFIRRFLQLWLYILNLWSGMIFFWSYLGVKWSPNMRNLTIQSTVKATAIELSTSSFLFGLLSVCGGVFWQLHSGLEIWHITSTWHRMALLELGSDWCEHLLILMLWAVLGEI